MALEQIIYFKEAMAVGQKSAADSGPYGQGFNYWVEVGFLLSRDFSREKALSALRSVVAALDHRALGVDVVLGFAPTSLRLCAWIGEEIERKFSARPRCVRLLRGDGLVVEWPAQSKG